LGEVVEELTRGDFHYRRVGLVRFKGKVNAIEVFTPVGESGKSHPAWLEGYRKGVEFYRKREFAEAVAAFEGVRAETGGEDRLCEMYLAECKSLLANAPSADWDGAWALTEK
jgi:hypothetical protein